MIKARNRTLEVVLPFFFLLFLMLSSVLLTPQSSGASEEYAKQTCRTSAAFHLDPGGGGELTAAGKSFAAASHVDTENPEKGMIFKGFRLVIGYLHFLTAIFWFGTILYYTCFSSRPMPPAASHAVRCESALFR